MTSLPYFIWFEAHDDNKRAKKIIRTIYHLVEFCPICKIRNLVLLGSLDYCLKYNCRDLSTEVNPDFTPSVSVVLGEYETQEQAKQAQQAIQHTALIAAWYH